MSAGFRLAATHRFRTAITAGRPMHAGAARSSSALEPAGTTHKPDMAGKRPGKGQEVPANAAAAAPKRRRAQPASVAASSTAEAEAPALPDESTVATPVQGRQGHRRRAADPLPFTEPTADVLAAALGVTPGPLPVPNLGYACLNSQLRALRPPVFTSRDCMKRTLDRKGLPHLGELCLANATDLARIIQWNHEHGVRVFRMSSVLFPWMGQFEPRALPQYHAIEGALRFAGQLARAHGQRLTFHPSHFVKLAAPDGALVDKSLAELEAHSQILDLLGFDEASPWNKINIHVGGIYGDKRATLQRWAAAYRRLSPRCRARVTVENDDVSSAFSVSDLLELHGMCGVPIVFDFHHHKFCPGGLSEREALLAAVATWPAGVRPVVHWSESQAGRRPHAHSDYVRGPIFLHGLEPSVDVMIEAKAKEQALLCYRDGLPIPEAPAEEEPPLPSAAAVAQAVL